MYISGVPGTGKTATVKEVMKLLEGERDEGNLADFKFIEINGMRLTEPRQAYVEILKVITPILPIFHQFFLPSVFSQT